MTTTLKPSDAGMDEVALARLDASVQADIDAGRHFGASLLVARGGKIVHRANLGAVAPNRPSANDDRYLLMSMSKAFTAVLVLRAIEAGRFQLDTRVDDGVARRGVNHGPGELAVGEPAQGFAASGGDRSRFSGRREAGTICGSDLCVFSEGRFV